MLSLRQLLSLDEPCVEATEGEQLTMAAVLAHHAVAAHEDDVGVLCVASPDSIEFPCIVWEAGAEAFPKCPITELDTVALALSFACFRLPEEIWSSFALCQFL